MTTKKNERLRRRLEKAFMDTGLFPNILGKQKTRCNHKWNIIMDDVMNDERDRVIVNKCSECESVRRQDYSYGKLIRTSYVKGKW